MRDGHCRIVSESLLRTCDCHCEGAVTDDSDVCVTVTAERHVTQAVTAAAARVTVTAE